MKPRITRYLHLLMAVLFVLGTSNTALGGRPARPAERIMPPRSTVIPTAPRLEPPAANGPIENISLRKPHRSFQTDVIARLGRPDPLVIDARVLETDVVDLAALARRDLVSARRRVEVEQGIVKVKLLAPEREEVIKLSIPEGSTLKAEEPLLREQLRRLPAALEASGGRPIEITKESGAYVLQLHDGLVPLRVPDTAIRELPDATVDVVIRS